MEPGQLVDGLAQLTGSLDGLRSLKTMPSKSLLEPFGSLALAKYWSPFFTSEVTWSALDIQQLKRLARLAIARSSASTMQVILGRSLLSRLE